MMNPQKELGVYLEVLTQNLSFIKAYQNQLRIISEWKHSKRYPAIQTGSFFFLLVVNSFYNTILLELYKLSSHKESRNIIDWLNKAKDNCKALNLKQSIRYGKYKVVKSSVYTELIVQHQIMIKDVEDTIHKLQDRRDKFIAHSDKKYFANPEKLMKDFPITDKDISSLIDTINEILHKHYSLLFQTDIDMSIHSSSNVDSILKGVLAFNKVWHDKKLIKMGIKPVDYLIDEEETLI